MKKALLTGSSGFIARHLLPELVEAGYHVRGTEDLEVCLSETTRERLDLVVHCAANIVNVDRRAKMGMEAYDDLLLDHMMCTWIEQHPPNEMFVVMSSCAVDFPADPYCIVKRTLEAFAGTLHKRGVPVTVLRPFSGYGSDQSEEYPFRAILERVRRRENPVTVWGGEQVRDFVHVDDIVRGIMMAAAGRFPLNTPMELGTGVGTSLKSLAEQMIDQHCGLFQLPVACDTTKAQTSSRRVADWKPAAACGWQATVTLTEGIARALAVSAQETSVR